QMVSASGSQTSNPAMRYFFKGGFRRAASMAGARAAAGAGSGRRAAGRTAVGGRGRGGCGAVALGVGRFGGATTALEVGGVPARPLELEAGGGELLREALGAAGRAGGQHRVGDLLQHVFRVAAGSAAIGVDRHGLNP